MAEAESDAGRAVVAAAEPQLFVTDIQRSCAFFARLGFKTEFTYGDPPFYAQVRRDRGRINLRHMDQPVIDPALRDAETLLAACITTDDPAALFAEYTAAGIVFHQTLRAEAWGARTFIVRDPDGNLLLFT